MKIEKETVLFIYDENEKENRLFNRLYEKDDLIILMNKLGVPYILKNWNDLKDRKHIFASETYDVNEYVVNGKSYNGYALYNNVLYKNFIVYFDTVSYTKGAIDKMFKKYYKNF